MVDSIVTVLMERDGLTKEEAKQRVADARESLWEALGRGEMPYDICEDEFGLEADYLDFLI